MKEIAYAVGVFVVLIGSVVGGQFIIYIHNHRRLDYFHDGTLFQALCAIALGFILMMLVNLYEAIAKSSGAETID